MGERLRCVVFALLALGLAAPVEARELWLSEDGERSLDLDTTLKGTWLFAHAPDDPVLFPERDSASNLGRLRLSLGSTLPPIRAQVDYEHGTLVSSEPTRAAGIGLLPASADAPYRLWQLDWDIVDQPNWHYRHGFDRGFVTLDAAPVTVTVGRQALGYGRGVLFTAVDPFAPFSPLEVDREWRRGVDAAHVDVALADTVSVDAVVTPASDRDDLVVLGRLRGYWGLVDAALLGGKRAEDEMVGASVSAAVLDAEAHGELALYVTDGRGIETGAFGTDTLVPKALVGGSYGFPDGPRLLGEYHYSGFGARDLSDDPAVLLDVDWQRRLVRGDFQIVGRHALALTVSYEFDEALSASLLGLVSPVDGSGVASPSVAWRYTDAVALSAGVYVPWGKGPQMGVPGSEYGSSPLVVMLQAGLYD